MLARVFPCGNTIAYHARSDQPADQPADNHGALPGTISGANFVGDLCADYHCADFGPYLAPRAQRPA